MVHVYVEKMLHCSDNKVTEILTSENPLIEHSATYRGEKKREGKVGH